MLYLCCATQCAKHCVLSSPHGVCDVRFFDPELFRSYCTLIMLRSLRGKASCYPGHAQPVIHTTTSNHDSYPIGDGKSLSSVRVCNSARSSRTMRSSAIESLSRESADNDEVTGTLAVTGPSMASIISNIDMLSSERFRVKSVSVPTPELRTPIALRLCSTCKRNLTGNSPAFAKRPHEIAAPCFDSDSCITAPRAQATARDSFITGPCVDKYWADSGEQHSARCEYILNKTELFNFVDRCSCHLTNLARDFISRNPRLADR